MEEASTHSTTGPNHHRMGCRLPRALARVRIAEPSSPNTIWYACSPCHSTPESARREPGELQCDHARTPSVRCTHVAVLQGVAYLYGFGVRRDARIAAKWFELSGLPEGMMALAVQVPQFRVRPTVEDSPLRAPFLP